MLKDLRAMEYDDVLELVLELDEKKYRAEQIYSFIYKNVENIDDIKIIPKDFREKLKEKAYISTTKIYKKFESKLDRTIKYLIELEDGNIIEAVLMRYKFGNSLCLSTQVGCRMGCKFCASTIDGLERNLSAGEMIGEILTIQKDIGEKINNIVMMGAGEPLDNFENVKKFFYIVHSDKGLNMGYRHITVSTCGIVDKIYKLADLNLPINLAISLHQTKQEKRKEIMPIANKFDIDKLIESAKYYSKKTKRRITYEYALIEGINNDKKTAWDLSKLLKGTLSHVNLIPVNTVESNSFRRPSKESIKNFMSILQDNGIQVTVRRELGSDISGACGQLKRHVITNKKEV